MRDPAALGNALLLLSRDRNKKVTEIADEIDRGVLGVALINPAFLNGRSSERLGFLKTS